MKLSQLTRTHADYDAAVLQTYRDLFVGGASFRKNVGEYLPKNDMEPTQLWEKRCARAHYVNYVAPIAGYFASLLFTCPPEAKAEPEADEQIAQWKEDCDGNGTDFHDFLRARFLDALVDRSAFCRVEFPAGDERPEDDGSLKAWRESGAGIPRLVPIKAKAIVNWLRNDDGSYAWLLEYDKRAELLNLADPAKTVTETWTLWSANGDVKRWAAVYLEGKAPKAEDDIPEAPAPANKLGRLPIVELCLPPHLWLLDHLASGQLENFRARNALAWSIYRTCYAMPVFKLKNPRKPPAMGAGYYLTLGVEDELDWPAPPSGPFDTIAAFAASLKDELYRVASQMAAGVDNNAAAVGRSGDSKQADQRATEAVLPAFGVPVRAAAEQIYDLVSAGRGEKTVWSVGGMDRYSIVDSAHLADEAVAAGVLQIPSRTHKVELLTRVALAQLPDADEATKAAIRKEIEAGVEDPAAQKLGLVPPPPPAEGEEGESTDPEKNPEDDEPAPPRGRRFPPPRAA